MIGQVVVGKTNVPVLMKALDASMLRARTIANNVANVDTPGYQKLAVSFEDELRRALDKKSLQGTRTDKGHLALGRRDLSAVQPRIERPVDHTLPSGVNNVDIDHEMASLAENQLIFSYATRFVKGIYTKLTSALQARSINIQ